MFITEIWVTQWGSAFMLNFTCSISLPHTPHTERGLLKTLWEKKKSAGNHYFLLFTKSSPTSCCLVKC